jgi:hypothetical protein
MSAFEHNLKNRQARAIEALMSEPSIKAAAKKSGVGFATLRRWLQDPAFNAALRDARSQVFERTMVTLAAAAETAVEVLREVMTNQAAAESDSASVRVRAARVALGAMLRSHDLVEIEQRLKALEERLLGERKF